MTAQVSVLRSYGYNRGRELPGHWRLMLDSGAFGGVAVTPQELGAWYKTMPHADQYAALDVMYEPEQSRANALAMRDMGLDVIPVVHAGTDPAEVDRLAADGFAKVALGGMVAHLRVSASLHGWANAVLDRADAHGMPAHGFGLARLSRNLPLLMRFATVDSTAWQQGARFGKAIVWDGMRLRALHLHRQRLEVATLIRSWPVDLSEGLRTGHKAASHPVTEVISAVSFLLFGEWMMARGGPRVYLAAWPRINLQADELLERTLTEMTT